ncbi:hypothetical protein [Sphingomonas haloaromaticamans]|nr:hypothetical protein [Sphingomonas haloaromaticamans]
MVDNKDTLCAALHQDFGTPPFKHLFEITMPSGVIKYCRENLKPLIAPQATPIPPRLEATGNRGRYLQGSLRRDAGDRPIQRADPAAARWGDHSTPRQKPLDPQARQYDTRNGGAVCQADPAICRPEDVAVVTTARQEIGDLLASPFDSSSSPFPRRSARQ